jgi:PKD repeat protein
MMRIFLLFACINVSCYHGQNYFDIIPDTNVSPGNNFLINATKTISSATMVLSECLEIKNMSGFMSLVAIESNTNCEIVSNSSQPQFVSALSLGSPIGSSNYWLPSQQMAFLDDGNSGCQWVNVTDRYLGVRIKKSGQWHYGWIRMDETSGNNATVKVKDYAFNPNANASINAGSFISASPTASFSASSSSVCLSSVIKYKDLSGNSPNSWSWSFPGGTPSVSVVQNPTVNYNSLGSYSASLICSNANGTSNTMTMSIVVSACTALSSEELVSDFKVMPNPSLGQFKIGTNNHEVYSVEIFNAFGKECNVHINRLQNAIECVVAGPVPGIHYLLVRYGNGKMKVQKILFN